MPVFIDRSGQLFEGDADPRDLAAQGIREATPEDIDKHNRQVDYDEKSALGKAGDIAVGAGQAVARGAMAPGMAIQKALTGSMPAPEAGREQSTLEEGAFEAPALERRERHPITAGVGEAIPSVIAGAATGGSSTGLLQSAAMLGAESAISGLSQEAIDSVIAKRDFSASSALWNGVLDLAFGAVGYGAGRALRGADEVADAASGPTARRNWLGEVDKGPVPSGAARSAGAAGEDFADDVWDDAIKSIDHGGGGKGLTAEAQFLADPKNAEPLTELASAQVADNLDRVNAIVKRDISEAVRVADVHKAAASWSDEMLEAQDSWAIDNVVTKADEVTNAIREAKKAASIGEGFDAGGFGSKAIKDIEAGAARVAKTTGAERFNAINNLKRNVDGVIRDVTNARSLNQGDAGQLIAVLRPYTDNLRAGLELEELWGAAAPMQREVNAAYHALIEPLARVEARLTERLGKTWGEVGQAGVNKRARAGAVGALMRGSPSANREFVRDLAEAFDGLEQLASARQAHGLSRLEMLPDLHKGLSEIKQDLNMATTLAVARRKAGEAGSSIGGAAADAAADFVGSKVPLVGGAVSKGLKGAARKLLNAPSLPAPGTPLRKVLDARLRAWSRNPDLADTGFAYQLPEWLRGALKGQGAPVPGPGGGGGASPAAQRAQGILDRRKGQTGAVLIGRAKLDPSKVKTLQARGSEVARRMSEQEIDAIRSFTSRHGDKVGTPEWDSAIEKLTVKSPTDAGPLYRGTRMRPEQIDDLLRRGTWTNAEPTSLSYNRDLSDAFAEGRTARGEKVLFQVEQLDEGVNLLARELGIGRSGLEREINLAKPTTLHVLGSSVDDGVTVIRLGSRSGERGFVESGPGVADILKSPMGLTAGAGVGLAAAHQLTPEQQANREQLRQRVEGLTPEEQQVQIRTVEGFARLGASTTQRVKAAVTDLFASAMDPDKPRPRSAKLRAIDSRAEKLGVTRSVARFMGRKTDDLFEAFDARKETIGKIVSDPAALARSMADNLGDLPKLQPEIFSKMVAQTYRAAVYLHADMPGNAGKSILNPEGYPPTIEEIEEWAGKWSGALHPLDAIEDLAANDLQPEQMDAVQAVHPEAYGMFQQLAVQHIALLGHRGRQIPQQALEQIDTALSLDGACDPLLTWGMADLIASSEAQVAQQKAQAPAGAPPRPMNFETPENLASSSLATLRPQ